MWAEMPQTDHCTINWFEKESLIQLYMFNFKRMELPRKGGKFYFVECWSWFAHSPLLTRGNRARLTLDLNLKRDHSAKGRRGNTVNGFYEQFSCGLLSRIRIILAFHVCFAQLPKKLVTDSPHRLLNTVKFMLKDATRGRLILTYAWTISLTTMLHISASPHLFTVSGREVFTSSLSQKGFWDSDSFHSIMDIAGWLGNRFIVESKS